MTTYHYRGMDDSGATVRGFLDAGSIDEAQEKARGRKIFVTNIAVFAPEVTPEWSAISLSSPGSIPSGRLLAQGLPCTHEHRGMRVEGSLNVLGANGELYLILDRPEEGRPALELPVQTIEEVKLRGFLRTKLLVTTAELEEHVFRGRLLDIQRLCDWATFAAEKAT